MSLNTLSQLSTKIEKKSVRVGVMGLGYVGLPLAVAFAQAGCRVVGYDVDDQKCKSLSQGNSYIPDIPSSVLGPLVKKGFLVASSYSEVLAKVDVVVVCVPTPLGKSKDPDISYIVASADVLAVNLRKGQLVVLESTTYPGTTRELILPKLESRGLRVGRDFFLAFSPERIDPGNSHFGLGNTPKIVSGFTPTCLDVVKRFYGLISNLVVPVSSLEAAEMSKLLENTFRAVNIALVNEVALMCNRLGLNVWEVIDAAATKPFGYMKFFPGPGIGGHCIPLDPHYLSWKLKTLNFNSRFIELAEDINSFMPRYVVERLTEALNMKKKAVRGARILLLGVAYKKDISDVRESPALRIIDELMRLGAEVSFSDPFVTSLRVEGRVFKRKSLTAQLLSSQDAVVLVTDHSQFDMPWVVSQSSLLLDTRNATRNVSDRQNIVLL
jgi:UDP-N-acetyl-D-glucosamine dehydrogenase